jgi:hypothetical protein
MRVSKYLPLKQAAELIADNLGEAEPRGEARPAFLEAARQRLIQALFEGEVRSEGVLWETPSPPDQSDPFTRPEVWVELERGWWSKIPHENLKSIEKIKNNQLDQHEESLRQAFYRHLETAQKINVEHFKCLPQSPADCCQPGVLFEKMTLYWDRDFFEIYDDDGTLWGYGDIRVNSRDLKSCFGVRLADVEIAKRRGEAPKRPSPQKQEEILLDMLSFPPKTRTRDEICKHMVDKHKISRAEARNIFDKRVPRCRKFGRGEKRSLT